MSKSSEALVGAAGMKDRKRGLSHETTAVDSLSTKSLQHVGGVVALGPHQPGQLGVERLDEAAEVEGDRVHGQALPARRQDEVGHRLVVAEHRRSPSGGCALPGPAAGAGRRARPPRPGWPPRASGAPVLAATSATSSNSGLARPLVDLHPDDDAVDGHLVERAGRPASARRRRPDPHGAGDALDLARRRLDEGGVGQDVEDMAGPALLHGDRADPGVEGAGVEGGRDGVAQLLARHVVEVGLEDAAPAGPGRRRRARRAGRSPPGCSWAGRPSHRRRRRSPTP